MGEGDAVRYEPAWTWTHYQNAPDTHDRDGRCFESKAERVKTELWVSLSRTTLLNSSYSSNIFGILTGDHRVYMQDFYRLGDGYAEKAEEVQDRVCKKLVLDMHYEAQIQCVINYSASQLGKKMSKAEARTFKLTQTQYEEVKLIYSQIKNIA